MVVVVVVGRVFPPATSPGAAATRAAAALDLDRRIDDRPAKHLKFILIEPKKFGQYRAT